MSHVKNRHNSGFTLVELSLAMCFVSVLLLAIALTTMQIANTYTKGMTLKDVNQAGNALASEFKDSISESSPFNLSNRYIQQSYGGRLCIGQYSYVWNYGKALLSVTTITHSSGLNTYRAAADTSTPIRLVKVYDPTAKYCNEATVTSSTGGRYIDKAQSIELLGSSFSNMTVHSLSINSISSDTNIKQQLYGISFLIGTNTVGSMTNPVSIDMTTCKAPNVAGADPLYCAINQFDLVVRAGDMIE